MAGSRGLRFIQLGKETTAGTAVAATTIWRGQGAIQEENPVEMPLEDVGIFPGADRAYIPKLGAVLQMDPTPATFEQMPYICAAGIKSVVTGVADSTGSGKVYAYPLSTTAANAIATYTIEGGDDQQEEEFAYGFVEQIKLSGKAGEAWMMSGNWRGQQVTPSTKTASLSVPTVEEMLFQKTSLYLDAAGGTLGSTQVSSTLIQADITINTGWVARWTADGNLYFSLPVLGRPTLEIDLTLLYNSSAVTEKANWRAKTTRQLQLKTIGSALTTSATYSNKTMLISAAGKWTQFDKLGEDSGNDIVKGKFIARYNSTAALYSSITIVNELTSLP